MGKYRRYRKVKKRRKNVGRLTLLLGIIIAIVYIFTTFNVTIPVSGDFLSYSLSGVKAVNVTLLRVKYIAPPDTNSSVVKVYVDGKSTTFKIPEGKEGYTIYLNESRLFEVNQENVRTQIVVPGAIGNLTYPGPPLNMSYIGKSEDYIVSHLPFELYFIFTTQLCNVTVYARPSGVVIDELKLEFIAGENRPKEELHLKCDEEGCKGSPSSRCVLSYNVVSRFTYFGVLKLEYSDGKTSLKFIDNIWIPISLYIITMILLYTSLRIFCYKKQYAI